MLGDLNLDLILSGLDEPPAFGREILARTHSFKAGGSGANTAMVLALLGAPVRLFACIGRDQPAALVLGELRRSGLSPATLRRLGDQGTAVTVSLSYAREAMYLSSSGTVAGASLEHFKAGYLRPGAHLHLSSYFLQRRLRSSVAPLLQRAKRLGMTTSLDPGHDPEGRWDLRELEAGLSALDWFLPNETELRALADRVPRHGSPMYGAATEVRGASLEQCLERLAALFRAACGGAGPGIVGKAGAQGAWLWYGGAARLFPSTPCEVVDTTCAGDCFDAGFLFALARGRAVEEAVRIGNRLGALGVSCVGLPSREVLAREARVREQTAKGGVT